MSSKTMLDFDDAMDEAEQLQVGAVEQWIGQAVLVHSLHNPESINTTPYQRKGRALEVQFPTFATGLEHP